MEVNGPGQAPRGQAPNQPGIPAAQLGEPLDRRAINK